MILSRWLHNLIQNQKWKICEVSARDNDEQHHRRDAVTFLWYRYANTWAEFNSPNDKLLLRFSISHSDTHIHSHKTGYVYSLSDVCNTTVVFACTPLLMIIVVVPAAVDIAKARLFACQQNNQKSSYCKNLIFFPMNFPSNPHGDCWALNTKTKQ